MRLSWRRLFLIIVESIAWSRRLDHLRWRNGVVEAVRLLNSLNEIIHRLWVDRESSEHLDGDLFQLRLDQVSGRRIERRWRRRCFFKFRIVLILNLYILFIHIISALKSGRSAKPSTSRTATGGIYIYTNHIHFIHTNYTYALFQAPDLQELRVRQGKLMYNPMTKKTTILEKCLP